MQETKLTMEQQMRLADLFRMFADTTRSGILSTLSEGEMCVGELADKVGLTVSAVSHQLRLLRAGKLVCCRREGKQMFLRYRQFQIVLVLTYCPYPYKIL